MDFTYKEQQDASPTTQVGQAYAALRRDIIEGRLQPGSRLRVEHLKLGYGVGSGTLREALSLLVADALVTTRDQRGFNVTPISLEDLEDITNTRIVLECEALRNSIRLGDEHWESRLIAAFHLLTRAEERLSVTTAESFDEWERRNREYHRALISACPSRWTHHFLGILYQQAERYRRLVITRKPIPRDVHAEHEAIQEAALARDDARACELLARHIATTADAVRQLPQDLFGSSE